MAGIHKDVERTLSVRINDDLHHRLQRCIKEMSALNQPADMTKVTRIALHLFLSLYELDPKATEILSRNFATRPAPSPNEKIGQWIKSKIVAPLNEAAKSKLF